MAGKNRVVWEGLKEYMDALQLMPAECAGESGKAIEGEMNQFALQYRTQLPTGPTGNLKQGVQVIALEYKGKLTPGAGVKNAAFHAHLWEFGTKKRVLKGRRMYPAGTNRGTMPKGNLFVPMVVRTRRTITGLIHAIIDRYWARIAA